MKPISLCLLLSLFLITANAQNSNRRINFRSFGRDSINLPLNEAYYLIEDSCAQIIRYGHFSFQQRKFYGKFKDVSKADPTVTLAEGAYTTDGLKNGPFITHYLNGSLQAKGNFKDDKYDSHWEMYYDDGKPELTFEVTNGETHIIDQWKQDGTKTVDNGNGTYTTDIGGAYWKGKLVNGKPDGTWRLYNKDDISNIQMASESFKKGAFRDGSAGSFNYTDASHIALVNPTKLPFVNAEKMYISPVACNGTRSTHQIVNARYRNGLDALTNYISQAATAYFSTIDLKGIENEINIDGEISEQGSLTNLHNEGSTREEISRGIILRLAYLPALHPATVDGKPVKQKFVITFKITSGYYKFTYRFLPVEVN